MTKEDAKKRIAELRKKNRVIFDLTFTEECVPYVKEEVTELTLSPDDFHYDYKKEIIDYKKDFIMALSLAAGIEIVDSIAIKESMFVHKSTTYITRKMPTGMNQASEAAYCFDVEARAEKEFANDIIKGTNKYNTGNAVMDEAMKRRRKAEMAELGASRADTGSHTRAIKKLIQIPSAQKKESGKYIMQNAIIFISKVTPNLDNSTTRNLYLSATFGNRKQINFNENQGMLPEPEEKKENGNTIKGTMENLQDDFDAEPFESESDHEPEIDYTGSLEVMKNNDYIQKHPAKIALTRIIDSVLENGITVKDCFELLGEFIGATAPKRRYEIFLELCLLCPTIATNQAHDKAIKTALGNKKITENELKTLVNTYKKLLEVKA